MHKPWTYESFNMRSFEMREGKYPIWVLSEKKAYHWMFNMLGRMQSNWNGYNITRLVRFQMEHAPESRHLRLPEMSFDMDCMLDSFCEVLLEVLVKGEEYLEDEEPESLINID